MKNIQKELPQDVFESETLSIKAMFSGAVFEMPRQLMIDLANEYKLRREGADSSKSVEPIPVFSGTNRVVINSRRGEGIPEYSRRH